MEKFILSGKVRENEFCKVVGTLVLAKSGRLELGDNILRA